jgi:hypothetical protein
LYIGPFLICPISLNKLAVLGSVIVADNMQSIQMRCQQYFLPLPLSPITQDNE